MQHIIKKQVIEIQLTDRKDAFHVQHEFHRFYWNRIIPELERIFDQLSKEDEVIHIDKLELDLGVLQQSQLNSASSIDVIYQHMIAKIREKIQDLQAEKHSKHSGNSIIMQWLYYMENGHLDWNTISMGEDWYQRVLEGLATDYNGITLLRKLIRSDRNALRRITANHDHVFLAHLAEVLSAARQDILLDFIRDLEKIITYLSAGNPVFNVAGKKIFIHKVWEKIIEHVSDKREGLTAEKLVGHCMDWLVPEENLDEWIQVITRAKARTFHQHLLKKTGGSREIEKSVKRKSKNNPDPKNGKRPEHFDKVIADNLSGKKENQKLASGERKKDQSSTDKVMQDLNMTREEVSEDVQNIDQDPAIDEIFTSHAGLVLLHPFLASLFTRLSMVRDGKFVNEASQIRAIHLLYYLATGKEDPEEYELVIPKFLIGYPLQKLITVPLSVQQEEKEEADGLLEAVIDNWKILGHTSPNALRESFLQRKGKLFSRDEKLYLHMEASAIDVLLDHLPWNLSIIKLSWMKDLLRVEWR